MARKGAAAPPAAAEVPIAPPRTPLTAERVLCELLLRSWIDKGAAEVSTVARIEDALELPAGRSWAAAAHDRIVVRTRAGEPATPEAGLMILDIAEPTPVLRWERALPPRARGTDDPGTLWQAWSDVVFELLRALV